MANLLADQKPQMPLADNLAAFERDGFVILRDALDARQRNGLRESALRLLESESNLSRTRGVDRKDGFRNLVALDPEFLPLIANARVLPTVIALLSPNLRVLSSQLISLEPLAPGTQRTIRTPDRSGWHRDDIFGVANDLGFNNVPRLAIKCAYYLSDVARPGGGATTFLPGSHMLGEPPRLEQGSIDPAGAITPALGPCDVVLFENRTWHAGGINQSSDPRLAVMIQYGYRWLAPVDDLYANILGLSNLSPVERQLLGELDRAADGSMAKGAGSRPLHDWWRELGGTSRLGRSAEAI